MKKMLIVILIMVFPLIVNAGQGCCSHHGGQDYCASNGKWICSDGWQSSCSCSNGYVSNSDFDSYSNSSIKNSSNSYDDSIDFEDIFGIFIVLGIFGYFFYPLFLVIKNDIIKKKK